MICSLYSGVECTMEQFHDEKKEKTWLNASVAGAVCGFVMGGMTKRFDIMSTSALGLGMAMGLVEYSGARSASNTTDTPYGYEPEMPTTVKSLKEKYPEFKKL